jgi:hypothetical protein
MTSIISPLDSDKSFQADKEESEWTIERLKDELYLSLINIKAVFCLINTKSIIDPEKNRREENNNIGKGVLRRKYEEYARYIMYRIPVFQPAPFFIVSIRDLTPRIRKELAHLDIETLDDVMRESVGRIFAQVNERFFLLSARHLLHWKLE